jgi:uncharacterized membrane protein
MLLPLHSVCLVLLQVTLVTKLKKIHILDAMFMCHKLPERSFFYKEKKFPVCARCTGILVGYILAITGAFFIKMPLLICLALLVPIGVDGVGQYLGKWTSTNPRRLITGILAGIATVYIIILIGKVGYYQGYNLAKWLK